MLKPLTVRITTNWKILRDENIRPSYLQSEKPVYADQEAKFRTRYGTTNWFKIGKAVRQGCMLSPCLLNFYAEHIMWNARLDKAQAVIKIAGRNINNLWHTNDTPLMAEGEELKSLLMKVKEENERVGLNSTFKKLRSSFFFIFFFFFGGGVLQIHCSHKIKRRLLLGRKAMTNLYIY